MARKITMVVGQPCVGKSQIFRRLLEDKEFDFFTKPFAHHRTPEVAILGRYDEDPKQVQFPGTDRLSMSIAPTAREWIAEDPMGRNVLFEGDRLGNLKMADWCIAQGYDFLLVVIEVHEAVLAARRREERVQRDAFVKGQATKVANLVRALPNTLVEVRSNSWPDDARKTAEWLRKERF